MLALTCSPDAEADSARIATTNPVGGDVDLELSVLIGY